MYTHNKVYLVVCNFFIILLLLLWNVKWHAGWIKDDHDEDGGYLKLEMWYYNKLFSLIHDTAF